MTKIIGIGNALLDIFVIFLKFFCKDIAYFKINYYFCIAIEKNNSKNCFSSSVG